MGLNNESVWVANSQVITIATPPEPIGYWKIGDGYSYMSFAMYKQFTPEQIKNTEELLGWVWVQGKTKEK